MPRVTKKPTLEVDPDTLLREFRKAQAMVRQATKRQNDIKDALVEVVKERGEPDEKGSLWVELPSGAALKWEKRVTTLFDRDQAEQVAAEHAVDCTETIVVFSEDKFLAAGYEKKIPDAAVSACYIEKENWAFTPKDAPK